MHLLQSQNPVLNSLTVTSREGTEAGNTSIEVTPAAESGNIYKYKISTGLVDVSAGQNVRLWSLWDGVADITAESGKAITIVEATADYKAVRSGSAVVIAK